MTLKLAQLKFSQSDLSAQWSFLYNKTQPYATLHRSHLHAPYLVERLLPTLISICISLSVSAQSSAWSTLARLEAYPSPATSSEANAFNKLSSWMPSFEIWPWTQISVLGRAKLYTVYIWYTMYVSSCISCCVSLLIVSHCLSVCLFNNLLTVVYLRAAMRYECRTWIRLFLRRSLQLHLPSVFPLGRPQSVAQVGWELKLFGQVR